MPATFPFTIDETAPNGDLVSSRDIDTQMQTIKQQFDAMLGLGGTGTSFGLQQVSGPVLWLTNNTGVSLASGDVVGIDTGNNSSVVLADVLNTQVPLAVYIGSASLANGSAGAFIRGPAVVTVAVTGAVVRGNWLVKSATTKVAQDSAVALAGTSPIPSGAFALALAANSGATVTALLTGSTAAPVEFKGADVASAAALNPGPGTTFDVTGAVTITSIASRPAGTIYRFRFTGALTITYNATSLILANAVNLLTVANDIVTFRSLGSGNWEEVSRRLSTAPLGRMGTAIASAAALVLGADGDTFHVTGAVTITSIGTRPAGTKLTLIFDAALILTHNATTLILQDAVNLTTTANDVLRFVSEGSGNWREEGRRLTATSWLQTTEGTTTNVTADLVTATVAIPAAQAFWFIASLRKTAGAAVASDAGLKLNATVVRNVQAWSSANNQAEQGMIIGFVGRRTASYLRTGMIINVSGEGGITNLFSFITADIPTAALTSIIVQGNSNSALVTMGARDLFVWALPINA